MGRMKVVPVVTLIVGVLSLAMFALERLALTDILHGEVDASLEWAVVNITLVPVALFHVLGLICAILSLKLLRRASSQ
jgi:hypothetical protein